MMSKVMLLVALTGVVTGSVAKIELDVSFSPPVIDIAPLVHPDAFSASDTARVRLEILQASNRWGFFQVINHGIQESMQNELVHQMKLFFGSPQDTKYTVRRTEDNSRGFADDELTKRLKDVKEIFDVGQVPYTDLTPEALRNQIVDGYNQWPSAEYAHLQQFKPTVDAYYDACLALSRTLVKAMAAVIPCANETYFENAFDRHSSFLRLNYYPTLTDGVDAGAQPVQRTHGAEDTDNSAKNNDNDAIESTSGSDSESTGLPPRLGVSRHTDAGALTVLWQDLNPAVTRGLEVYSGSKEDAGDGVWVPVTPVPGSLTINTGDMLQVWSNGLLKAPEHRVRPTMDPQRERYSAPFFYNPNYDALVTPLTTQCSRAGTSDVLTQSVVDTVGDSSITIDAQSTPGQAASAAAAAVSAGTTDRMIEMVQQAMAAPRYNAIRWGDYGTCALRATSRTWEKRCK